MRLTRIITAMALCVGLSTTAIAIASCSLNKKSTNTNPPAAATANEYKGTASVGDFITFRFDATARTMSYVNITNGLSGSGTYTVNADGSYTISESSGCFTDALEIPGYALVLRGIKTGPARNTVSLVTSIDSQVNTVAGVANKNYNYMQFRTNSGGVEIGHVSMGSAAQVTAAGYWPFGSINGSEPFQPEDTFPGQPVPDPATGALKLTIEDEGIPTDNYIFATSSGLLAVDTGNGSLICLEEAASSALSVSSAGTYRALRYGKNDARTDLGNVETPTVGSVALVTITVGTDGTLLIRDAANVTLASGTLIPVAGSPLATGIGRPCPGLFYATIGTQQVFVTFTGSAMLFSSFMPVAGGSGSYDYFYGVGLKQVASSG